MSILPCHDREALEEYLLGTPVWVALLSPRGEPLAGQPSEERVFMLDGCPGEGLPSDTWAWLGAHIRSVGKRIVALGLAFRDHEEWPLPRGAAAYYFSRGFCAIPAGPSWNTYNIGHIADDGQTLVVASVAVPELQVQFWDHRREFNRLSPRIIWNSVHGEIQD